MTIENPFMAPAANPFMGASVAAVGDYVEVSWNYDRAYGPGRAMHAGTVIALDGARIAVKGSDRQGRLDHRIGSMNFTFDKIIKHDNPFMGV